MPRKLPDNIPNTRQYALIKVKGASKVCCFVNEEWIIDATCKALNDLLVDGGLSKTIIIGWIDCSDQPPH